MLNVSSDCTFRPTTVSFTLCRYVFIEISTPFTVPVATVPFFSSIVTVSFWSFIKKRTSFMVSRGSATRSR
jgi:hypothetical protein|tara:strand:- start:396 stop:608 length:213 start_codon:yes stop_codon:yes gene_type:complete